MIGLVLVAKITAAIVAFAVLGIILTLCIIAGVTAWRGASAFFVDVCYLARKNQISGTPSVLVLARSLWVVNRPLAHAPLDFFGVLLVIVSIGLGMRCPPLATPLGLSLAKFWVRTVTLTKFLAPPLVSGLSVLFSTLAALFARHVYVGIVGFFFACLYALPILGAIQSVVFGFCLWIMTGVDTRLALPTQSTFRARLFREVLNSKGLPLFAFRALFGRGRFWGIMGLHQKFTFLVSNPGALARRRLVFLLSFTPVSIPQNGRF